MPAFKTSRAFIGGESCTPNRICLEYNSATARCACIQTLLEAKLKWTWVEESPKLHKMSSRNIEVASHAVTFKARSSQYPSSQLC
eukprot:1139344-Pelagomonas_calceolata.AAC.5